MEWVKVIVGLGIGVLGAGLADTRLPGKGFDVPLLKVKDPETGVSGPIRLQAGAVGTVVAAGVAYWTRNPLAIGAALGGGAVEGLQYTHHYAPQLFAADAPKKPDEMTAGPGVNGMPDAPARPVAQAAPPPAPPSYTDAHARSFFAALDLLPRAA